MIAQSIADALRETAKKMIECADQLDVLGKLWIMDAAPQTRVNSTPKIKKAKAKAIRKDLNTRRRKRPHWTQTPEGKAKLAKVSAARWRKPNGEGRTAPAESPATTPS